MSNLLCLAFADNMRAFKSGKIRITLTNQWGVMFLFCFTHFHLSFVMNDLLTHFFSYLALSLDILNPHITLNWIFFVHKFVSILKTPCDC